MPVVSEIGGVIIPLAVGVGDVMQSGDLIAVVDGADHAAGATPSWIEERPA